MRPLCIDLYCGLGGWSEGFLAEGYECIGFDVERHDYGSGGYPGQLVLQDVLTLHGSQFRDADCIVASPPCQNYSYMAMPWQRSKREIRWQHWNKISPFSPNGFHLDDLFNACFRLQLEALQAAGRHIPLVVENVKGAQPWVGRAAWHYGSFYLWGDVPALMPSTLHRKLPDHDLFKSNGSPVGRMTEPRHPSKNSGGSWFAQAHNTESGHSQNPVTGDWLKVPGIKLSEVGFNVAAAQRLRAQEAGPKVGGKWFGSYAEQKSAGTISPGRLYGKGSASRKAASAQIAKIPFELASYIARVYRPPGLELKAVG